MTLTWVIAYAVGKYTSKGAGSMAQQGSPQLVSLVDPYVYQTLQKVVGMRLIVQTVKDTVRGKLKEVMPDHIVIEAGAKSVFYVRIRQIVSVMPDHSERV